MGRCSELEITPPKLWVRLMGPLVRDIPWPPHMALCEVLALELSYGGEYQLCMIEGRGQVTRLGAVAPLGPAVGFSS